MKNKIIYILLILYVNNTVFSQVYKRTVDDRAYEISTTAIYMKYNPLTPKRINADFNSYAEVLSNLALFVTDNKTETEKLKIRLNQNPVLPEDGMKLNLYYPEVLPGINPGNQELPVIIFGYGGGFLNAYSTLDTGIKAADGFIERWLAKQGYIVVAPEYRIGIDLYDAEMAKRAVWRAVQDVRMAIRKCKSLKTTKYSVDSSKPITYVGYSSGGFIGLHNLYFNETNRPVSTRAGFKGTFKAFDQNRSNITTYDLGDLDHANGAYDNGNTDVGMSAQTVQDITVSLSGALGDVDWITKGITNTVPKALCLIHHPLDGVVPYASGDAYGGFGLFSSPNFSYPQVSGVKPINDVFINNTLFKPKNYKYSFLFSSCNDGINDDGSTCITGTAGGSKFLTFETWYHNPTEDAKNEEVMKAILDFIVTSTNDIINNTTVNNTLSLTGVPATGHKVFLNWKAPIGNILDLKYTIYKSIGFENNSYIYEELVSGITNTNFEVTEVEGYKDISFKVVAKDNSGNEIVIAETVVKTLDEDPPSVVTNLTGSFDGNKIELNWDHSTDNATLVKYEICYVTGDQDVPLTSPIPPTDYNNHVLENPILNVNYKFRINSLDSNGNINFGGEIITVSTSNQPFPPLNLKVDTEAIKALNVNQDFEGIPLTWTASQSQGITYKLYYKSRSRDAINGSLEIPVGNTEFLLPVSTCPKPMDYELYMVAERGGFTSPKSETIFFNDSPSKPIFSFSSSNIENSLTLIWSKGTTIDKIHDWVIYKKKSIDTEYTIVKTIISDGTDDVSPLMTTVNDLDLSSIYSFKMVANDIFGNSSEYLNNFDANLGFDYCPPFSGAIPWDETTNKVSEGSFITNVLIENDVVQGPNGIFSNIFWNIYNEPETNISKNSDSLLLKVKVNAKDQNLNAAMVAYIDYNKNKNLEENEKITFGSLSNKGNSINVPLTFISDPIIIPNDAIGKTKMRIVYQRNNTSLNIDPCSFDGIGEVEDYIVNIVSISNRQNSSLDIIKNTKESIESEQQSIILFPNPVNGDILNISGVAVNLPYKIINMLGQVIETGKVENGTINVAKLPSNAYSLDIISNGLRVVKRFIKQ
jgi:GEVED domain/Secretion system C-terminal sorting domain/Carboxylesterase family